MGMFRNVNRENAFYEILDQIFENIQDGSLKQGDALPAERSMAEAMGISRPVLREALRALELLGIITAVHGGGNYISKDLEYCLIGPLSILFRLNNSSVQQAQELRSALECKAAALAAENVRRWMPRNCSFLLQSWMRRRTKKSVQILTGIFI